MFDSLAEAVRVAETLKKSFRDVVIDASGSRPVVKARDHLRGPPQYHSCPHERTRTARNVRAALVDGQWADPERFLVHHYEMIESCCHCDLVIRSKHSFD